MCHIQNPACSVGDSRDHLIGRIDHRTVITLTPAPAAHQIGRHRLPRIRRKCRSDCILSPASQGRIAGYRIGRDRSAYVRAQLAHSKGLSVSSRTGRRAVGRCRRWVNHGARARPASSGMSALSPIASEIRHRSEVTQGANRVLKHRSMAGY